MQALGPLLRTLRPQLLGVLAFLGLLLVLDQVIGFALESMFRRLDLGPSGAAVNRVRAARAQVVVLGSSRAAGHFVPAVLARDLGVSVYNAGVSGQGVPYMRGLADLLLREYRPLLFLVNVEPETMVDIGDSGRVAVLAPFLSESPVVRNLIYARATLERTKYAFSSFRFNGRPLQMLRDFFQRDESDRGYTPYTAVPGREGLLALYGPRTDVFVEPFARGIEAPRRLLLVELVAAARERGTRVAMVMAPRWDPPGQRVPDRERIAGQLEDLARELHVPFVDLGYERAPELANDDLWMDPLHLNDRGAEIFSARLAREISTLGLVAEADRAAAEHARAGS